MPNVPELELEDNLVPKKTWDRQLDKLKAIRENSFHLDALNPSGVTKNLDEILGDLNLESKRKITVNDPIRVNEQTLIYFIKDLKERCNSL